MKINYNISAMVSNDHLLFNEGRLADSTARLSSGLKINSAGDNPSGTAISLKMRAQIRGLDQASDNSKNGLSVLETADSAMGEMTDILQRMRELAVQAASDTNTPTDRDSLQLEIDSLTEELDRIASDTDFNTLNILDGSLNERAYASVTTADGTFYTYSNVVDTLNVREGEYTIAIAADATQGAVTTNLTQQPTDAGDFSINGVIVSYSAYEDASDFWATLTTACERADVTVTSSDTTFEWGSTLTFTSNVYGDSVELNMSFSTSDAAEVLGMDTYADPTTLQFSTTGSDVEIATDGLSGLFDGTESYITDGQRITIYGAGGLEMVIDAYEGVATEAEDATITVDVKDMGQLFLQIGANEDQAIKVEIPDMSTYALGIGTEDGETTLNIRSAQGANRAISILDDAISKMNDARASLGAYENRLDHTYNNLESASENVTSAYSRIMDVDMAEEMTTFTNMQILVQAGTSVLAQANELPDQALQMLR
ncbi:MAG: flagellin [Eubacterium sp.]|nr:flagellin [Eubacterium sp.]